MTKLFVAVKLALFLVLAFIVFVLASLILPPLFHKHCVYSLPRNNEVFYNAETEVSKERVLNIEDNDEALIWRLRLIENAKSELILTTFELGNDQSGKEIMAALYDASKRGVKVRILVDGFGAFARLKDSDCFKALISCENVEARIYNEINLLTPWKLNYRMHDKFLVSDSFAYILGGRNTNNLFLGNYRENYNLDRDILVYSGNNRNGSIDELKAYFEELWTLDCCKNFDYSHDSFDFDSSVKELNKLFSQLKREYPEAFGVVDWYEETFSANSVKLICNPINTENKAPELWTTVCDLMNEGEEILVQTPYIICSNEMYRDLETLTQKGKTVSIMTNSIANGANPWGCSDYLNQKDRIYACGVGVYEFLGDRSLHTKTVLIDNNISVVGSFNLDMRSAYLNTETMLVIDCQELNACIKESFSNATKTCKFASESKTVFGDDYVEKEVPYLRRAFFSVFRLIIIPFRYLL